jgi:hypothetical protein
MARFARPRQLSSYKVRGCKYRGKKGVVIPFEWDKGQSRRTGVEVAPMPDEVGLQSADASNPTPPDGWRAGVEMAV